MYIPSKKGDAFWSFVIGLIVGTMYYIMPLFAHLAVDWFHFSNFPVVRIVTSVIIGLIFWVGYYISLRKEVA